MSKPRLKFGFQCQERVEDVYRYNRELQPTVVKSVNILDRAHYVQLAADNPEADLVYRQVPNWPWHDDPEGDGRRWAEHLHRLVGHIPQITLVEGLNEWIHGPDHQSPDDYDRADRFMVALIDRVHELWGGSVHAVVLNASCGHFNEDIVDFFPRTLAKLQECGKCLLGMHEYDHPNSDMLGDGGHDLCGKFLRNLTGLKAAGYDKVRIAITECGVDSGVGTPAGSGHIGFKMWAEQASERYLNERNLAWYIPLIQEEEGVAWATLYGCGMHGDWSTFDIKGTPVVNGIGAIYSNWVPPEEPPEPPPEDKMDIKVVDMNYQEQDFQYAKDKYGVAFRRAEVEPGQLVWRLVELWEKAGTHSLVTQTLGEDGQAMPDVPITFYWPGAPDPPDPSTQVYAHDWYPNFVWARGNAMGEVGPGMGNGAWIDVDPNPPHNAIGGGPHAVWVHDPNIPSDICEKLGMRGGTYHDHLDQKFRLMRVGGGNGNGDDVTLKLKEVLVEEGHYENALAIAYPSSIAIDTRGDGRGPGVDEDIHPGAWEHPTLGAMALVELCADFEGDEPRTYTLRVYRMGDKASLTNTEAESFQPLGFPRKRVVYVYVTDTSPDEPPVDDDVLVAFFRLCADVAVIREKYVGGDDEPPEPPPDTAFFGDYFDNVSLDGEPVFTRTDEAIDFDWGAGSPDPSVTPNYFSARWVAKKTFEEATYQFSAYVDDGIRIYVDDELILDAWVDQPPTTYHVDVAMAAGQHTVRVEYYERAGGATCKVDWRKVA